MVLTKFYILVKSLLLFDYYVLRCPCIISNIYIMAEVICSL